MTMKALLTIMMIVTAVFVFKNVPAKTIADILILKFILTLFWWSQEKD